MKLYVCWTAGGGGMHPCAKAHDAVKEAGHEPEVVKTYGTRLLPAALNPFPGRKEVHELTGSMTVPLLVTDDGEKVQGSDEIVKWAKQHQKATAAGPAA